MYYVSLIIHFSVALIKKCDQKQLMEERACFGLWFLRDTCLPRQGRHDGKYHAWRLEQKAERSALKMKQREGTGTGNEALNSPHHSLPPGHTSSSQDAPSLHTVPLTGKQVFNEPVWDISH